MLNNHYLQLIEILIEQSNLIAKLLNENAEKENMINVLMNEFKETP